MVNANLTTSQNSLSGSSATNLVFIDTAVANFSSLLAGLSPNTEAIVLDPTQDGISQITNFLAQRSGIVDSIQILGHGAAGMLQLGATSLNADNLDQYQSALSTWFTPQADKKSDLVIYGCDVAAGNVGENFIQKLSQITGADVAASVDLTGSAAKGGNWILEKATGLIEVGQAFSQQVRDAYEDVLAIFTVTNNNDSGAGSLRLAIIAANNSPGADNIIFDIGAGGVQTIALQTPLPPIVSPITLDATTQPGFTGAPIIELRGDAIPIAGNANSWPADPNNPGTFTNGLTFWTGSNNSVAKGFIINRFESNGIKIGQGSNTLAQYLVNGPTGITIENNYIGTDVTGTVGLGNSWFGSPDFSNALYVHRSPNVVIRNNLISGNTTSALIIREGSTNALIEDNKIGTDVTGNFPLGNQRWNVYINTDSNNFIFRRNLVAAGGYDHETNGMEQFLTYSTSGGQMLDNTFGTDITGTKFFGNRGHYAAGITPNPFSARAYGVATVTGNRYQGTWDGTVGTGNTALNLPAPPQPVLTSIAPKLTTIPSDINSGANQGQLVSSLASSVNNPDGSPDKGIAITQVNNTGGTWQYSTDNGTNWTSLNQALTEIDRQYGFSLPAVKADFKPAFLLAADSKNRIRFVPDAGFSGTVNNGLVYNGWNQRTAGNGLTINIDSTNRTNTTRVNLGPLLNSLSTNADNLSIKVNKAPSLDPALVNIVGNIPVDPAINPGTLIGDILGTGFIDDQAVLKGMAVTEVDNSNGTWQYTLDGTTWQAFGNPSNASARLLAADGVTRIRFVPNSGYVGTPGLKFRAWDQFADWGVNLAAGGTADVNANGGSTPFSPGVVESRIGVGIQVVTPVPDPIDPPPVNAPAPLDISIIRLLKNPPAAPAPKTAVAGEAPISAFDNVDSKSEFDRLPDPISAFDRLPDPISIWENEPPKAISESKWATLPNDVDYISIYVNDPRNAEAKSRWSELPDRASAMSRYQPNPVTNTIRGTNGDDILAGTDTANTVFGLPGNDDIVGTPKPDNLIGGQGNDIIRGLGSRDFIRGGAGNDTIYGGRGGDVLFGEKGNDTIYGEKGNDFISGGNGQDTIYGGKGNDLISGGKGDDRLFGGKGNDVIYGDNGDDLIQGGQGNDVLTGGKGKDRFQLALNAGTDTITDFTVGEDVIELSKGLKFSDLQITQGVGATVIGFQPGTLFPTDKPLALLIGVNTPSLTPNSFLVV